MFERALPEFLAIGMTYEQFYDGPARLVVSYRAAHRLRRDLANFDAFLVGAYVYEAIQRNVPAINPFAKGKTQPWLKEPFDLHAHSGGDQEGNIQPENKPGSTGAAFMFRFMDAHNRKMEKERAAANTDTNCE